MRGADRSTQSAAVHDEARARRVERDGDFFAPVLELQQVLAACVPKAAVRIATESGAHQPCSGLRGAIALAAPGRKNSEIASYSVNESAVRHARGLIKARQYVLQSDWGDVQPRAEQENAFLESHSWEEYGNWHLGLTEGAPEETKAKYAFVYGDFRRLHRTGLIACVYRAAEWRHKDVELAAHELLQLLDRTSA